MYKESEDGVYCIYCSLFLTEDQCKSLKAFVNNDFSNWHQFLGKKARHETNSYHEIAKKAVKKTAYRIIDRFEYPRNTVAAYRSATLDARIKKYPKIIKILAGAMHWFGRQNLALRGHFESIADQ